MQLFNLLAISVLASRVIATNEVCQEEISAYQFNCKDSISIPIVDDHDALVYLSDKFGISDYYELGDDKKDLVKFIEDQNELIDKSTFKKPSLIVSINGIDKPEKFFKSKKPSFKVQNSKSFIHTTLSKFPKQLLALNPKEFEMHSLTSEIKLLTSEVGDNNELVNHFKFFNEKLLKIWQEFKLATINSIKGNKHQVVLNGNESFDPLILNLINDKFFINELSQLIHLNNYETNSNDLVFASLNSLLSIGKKAGFDSKTYKFSKKVLSDYLVALSKKFDLTVFSVPNGNSQLNDVTFSKRNKQLNEIFELYDVSKRSASSYSNSCFQSEESCQVSTSNCNNHGVCTKLKAKCWSCLCSSTFNKTTSKTTNWSGVDCNKKDISSEANLFLWTGLALAILFIGGIQLLINVGNESLPGVLDAATIMKKNP